MLGGKRLLASIALILLVTRAVVREAGQNRYAQSSFQTNLDDIEIWSAELNVGFDFIFGKNLEHLRPR
jgi:hypothetical protein